MRLHRTLALAASTLALATGAAFAGGDAMSPQEQQEFLSSMSPQEQQEFLSYGRSEAPLSDQSDPMGYQPYEVYDVYVVPVEEIVLIPLEPSSEPSISGNELG